jgi:hypothetical protein
MHYLLLILCPWLLAFAHQEQRLEDLARSGQWQKLMHYRSGESEADGEGFFLDPKGKVDPLSELQAHIKLFAHENAPTDTHPICKFPLRFKWLNAELGYPWRIDWSGCRNYQEFMQKISAKRADLVFASYYLNNPNSAFGHLFLRLSRFEDDSETEMLDYGVNFAANSDRAQGLDYLRRGLFGGFRGQFSAMPYYYKIREYSDLEFRDMWAYRLQLSPAQLGELVDHLWELQWTHFDYYYLQENCAYHVLGLIQVATPEKNFTQHFGLHTIPAEALRHLEQAQMLGPARKRASAFTRLQQRSQGLSDNQRQLARTMVKRPQDVSRLLAGLESGQAAKVLDTAMEAYDYFHAKEMLANVEATTANKAPLLLARARNPEPADEIKSERPASSPALGHKPGRLGLYLGQERLQNNYTRLEYRAAMHDMLDPPRGSVESAQLVLGQFALLAGERVILEQATLLSLKNFPVNDFWASPWAWELQLGVGQEMRRPCQDCPQPTLQAAAGKSRHFLDGRLLGALMIGSEINLHPAYQGSVRAGLGPRGFLRLMLNEKWVTGMTLDWHPLVQAGAREISMAWEGRYHLGQRFTIGARYQQLDSQRWANRRVEVGLQYFH